MLGVCASGGVPDQVGRGGQAGDNGAHRGGVPPPRVLLPAVVTVPRSRDLQVPADQRHCLLLLSGQRVAVTYVLCQRPYPDAITVELEIRPRRLGIIDWIAGVHRLSPALRLVGLQMTGQ